MVRCFVVALLSTFSSQYYLMGRKIPGNILTVTREDFRAAAESEPAVRLSVMNATAAAGQFLARDDAEFLFGLLSDGLVS